MSLHAVGLGLVLVVFLAVLLVSGGGPGRGPQAASSHRSAPRVPAHPAQPGSDVEDAIEASVDDIDDSSPSRDDD